MHTTKAQSTNYFQPASMLGHRLHQTKSFQDNHFRPQSKIHNSPFAACSSHAPQLPPWNFQGNCFDPNAKFTPQNSQFPVHRTQLPFHLVLGVATYHASQLVVHIQLLIVHLSRFAACCSYVQWLFTPHRLRFALHNLLCNLYIVQCRVPLMIRISQCTLLNSPDPRAHRATQKKPVCIMTLAIEDFCASPKLLLAHEKYKFTAARPYRFPNIQVK